MADAMEFPNDWAKFLEDYSFRDHEGVYTNGARLIPTFRVEQMMHHYLRKATEDLATDNNVGSKWIPVTERLPEDDLPKNSKAKQLKVLVAYKTNGRYVVRSAIRAKGYWHSKDGWAWIKMSDPITHWMPLPEPPKEGE